MFTKEFQPKAYIATYQDLGLVKDNHLTILSPVKKVKQYSLSPEIGKIAPEFNIYYKETLLKNPEQKLVNDAVSAYQSTSYWVKTNALTR